MKTILIVEDDPEIAKIESDYLERENFECIIAPDGKVGIQKFAEIGPDLVILDLNLPEIDGIEVCKQIRNSSGVPIIMVTAKTKEIDELLGLEIGADDYIKKPFSPRVLVSRVKALLKRPPQLIEGDTFVVADLKFDLGKRTVKKLTVHEEEIQLTTIQFNILLQLAQNPGKVFSREDLIDKAYDMADLPDIFDRTMDSHIKNIRKQLELDTKNPRYILTVRGIGYKFNENI